MRTAGGVSSVVIVLRRRCDHKYQPETARELVTAGRGTRNLDITACDSIFRVLDVLRYDIRQVTFECLTDHGVDALLLKAKRV